MGSLVRPPQRIILSSLNNLDNDVSPPGRGCWRPGSWETSICLVSHGARLMLHAQVCVSTKPGRPRGESQHVCTTAASSGKEEQGTGAQATASESERLVFETWRCYSF